MNLFPRVSLDITIKTKSGLSLTGLIIKTYPEDTSKPISHSIVFCQDRLVLVNEQGYEIESVDIISDIVYLQSLIN